MRIVSYTLLLIIILLGVSFAGLNASAVKIHYYFGENTLPLSLLLAIAFVVGGILGVFSSLLLIIRTKGANIRLKNRLKSLEKEVANLRATPVKER